MSPYNFYQPITIRYGDIDAQGHVNNARYLTYMEQARVSYLTHLDLWDGNSFLSVGIIIAEVQLSFKAPIHFGQTVQVGVRAARLGNKSLTVDHTIEDTNTGQKFAQASTVLVAYDYERGRTIPIPDHWRHTLTEFEGL